MLSPDTLVAKQKQKLGVCSLLYVLAVAHPCMETCTNVSLAVTLIYTDGAPLLQRTRQPERDP